METQNITPPTEKEGVIKFVADHEFDALHLGINLRDINNIRDDLRKRKWIEDDAQGIGYGNFSLRMGHLKEFMITGTQTSGLHKLSTQEFVHVMNTDVDLNYVRSKGLLEPSSETLSHAAIYHSRANARAVIHIHDAGLWERGYDYLPRTEEAAEYGTPAMALSVREAIKQIKGGRSGTILMAGHYSGLLAFGENLESAYRHLLSLDMHITNLRRPK